MAQAFRSTRVLTEQGLRPATIVAEGGRIAEVRSGDEAPADADEWKDKPGKKELFDPEPGAA